MESEMTINELLDSINNSINDIRSHPTNGELPSNFQIMMSGIDGNKGLDFLYSSGADKLIDKLFELINTGDFEKILENEDKIKMITDNIFGKGSFQGPVSTRVLNSIQHSMSSYKYQTMKSFLGKTVTQLKKIRLVMKNLEREKKNIKDKEELQKYSEAIYAIKQVLKIAEKVYRYRRLVNKKVFNGINNIIHEENEKE